MKVNGITYTTVELPVEEIQRIVNECLFDFMSDKELIHRIKKKFITNATQYSAAFIHEGQWCIEHEYKGHTTYFEKEHIRKATPEEMMVIEAFENLENALVALKMKE